MIADPVQRPCLCSLASPRCRSRRVCNRCKQFIGDEEYVCTKENLTLHARCFVCSKCSRPLDPRKYGIDLNEKLYCADHMDGVSVLDEKYRTLASGWLFKQGQVVKKFRRRYFVLLVDSCELRYYKSKDASHGQPNGTIDLSAVSSIQPAYLYVPSDKNHPEFPNGSLPALQLITPCRIWNLACETDSVREYWLDAIRTAQATCGSASAAASNGFGRGFKGRSSRGFASPSPPPCNCSSGGGFLSPPKVCLGSPVVPQSLKTAVFIPRPTSSTPGPFTQENDDAETSSPEDESVTPATRSRTGSGLGRGDGSAQASQSIYSTTGSNAADGIGTRRAVLVQHIVVPSPPTFVSNTSTPTNAGVSFAAPGSSNKKPPSNISSANGIGSPVQPWQPSTPRGAVSGSSWDSSSTSSHESDNSTTELRLRAVSLGANFHNQQRLTVVVPKKQAKVVIAHCREASQDSLLCCSSSNTTSAQVSAFGSPTKTAPDGDCGLSSFVFISAAR